VVVPAEQHQCCVEAGFAFELFAPVTHWP
jgi:hypothetical protein